MLRRLAAPALVLLALLAAAPAASAADSHAPRGARADWLPMTEWVMSSWLPYDEARLHRLLGTDREEVRAWLDDRRSLGALARQHGAGSVRALAHRLVATRGVPAGQRRVLEARARDTLTQPHLARHVLFHVFHASALAAAAPRVFGTSAARYRTLRNAGRSPLSIAAEGGRSRAELRSALDAFFAGRARRAVATRSTSAAQAAHLLAVERAGLDAYVVRSYRTPAQQQAFVCRLPA